MAILKKEKLKVVHDDDLEILLRKLNLLETIKNGEKKCKFCKDAITIDNLYSLFPQSGDIKIVCNKVECIKELSGFLREEGGSL
jgi:hypothetical protein